MKQTWMSHFAYSLMARNTKGVNLTWLPLEVMHCSHTWHDYPWSWASMTWLLPPQGFRPEAKSRGTLVTRAYIKDITLQFKYTVSILEKILICSNWGREESVEVMMTFLLFAPTSTKWLGWRNDRKSWRDRSGRFCDIYCAVILWYSYAVTFCGAVVLKVMDQKTLVKRRGGYKVRLTVYI